MINKVNETDRLIYSTLKDSYLYYDSALICVIYNKNLFNRLRNSGYMKTLIIGANGQLGSYLVKTLEKENEVIPIYHNKELGESLDIENYKKVEEILEKYNPMVIINTSAFHQVDLCETEEGKKKAFAVNSDAIRNLAKSCKNKDIVLIHISTDYVFDGKKREHYTEEDMPNPINTHGKSKLEGEKAIREIMKKYFLIRTSSLYGKKGSGQKGTNLILALLNAGKKGEVRAVFDNKITPTYAKDVADKITELLKTDLYGIYHLSNSGKCSVYELAKEICEIENIEPKIEKVTSEEMNAIPGKAPRPLYSQLSSINLKKAGFSEMRPWQEALRDYLKEIKMENELKINLDINKKIEPNNKKIINGVELVTRITKSDDRGHLTEVYRIDEPYHKKYNGPIRQVYIVENDVRGVIRAFHKHKELWDFFSIANGGAKFILIDDRPESETYGVMNIFVLNAKNKSLLVVPPGVFHGWMSLTDNTQMLSIASHTYNYEKPDEIRIPPNAFGSDWEVKGR